MQVPYVDMPARYSSIRERVLESVDRVFSTGRFVLGAEVERFEERFAKLCGAEYAISVANGTDALVLALRAYGIGEGDEVITAPNSFVASAAAIVAVGGRPVFVDVGSDQNMDPDLLKTVITDRTRAIMPIHLTGKCADMTAIGTLAADHDLIVIEDAAQAVMSSHKGVMSGALGQIGCFSLHPLKNLSAFGDGGVITTSDPDIAVKLQRLRNHGLLNRDEVGEWGFNSRLDPVQAAILNVQLDDLGDVIARRRSNADRYRSQIGEIVQCPTEGPDDFHTYQTYVVQANDRNALQSYLESEGIGSRVHYPIPIHLQPAARELGYGPGDFPVTERQADTILSLPVHENLTNSQIDFVSDRTRHFYRNA
jgi:dTDP-4-amino-4,6-dideoxygalactose transaminase